MGQIVAGSGFITALSTTMPAVVYRHRAMSEGWDCARAM